MTPSSLYRANAAIFIFAAFSMLMVQKAASQPSTALQMPTPRYGMCSAQIGDQLFLIGGNKGDVQELRGSGVVEAFNLETREWNTQIENLHVPRVYASAVAFNGKIFVMGGINQRGEVVNSVEAYNFTTKEWEQYPSMLQPRSNAAAVAFGNYIYVLGGADSSRLLREVERYSPEDSAWQEQPPDSIPRASHAAVSGMNDIFILGGVSQLRSEGSVEKYLPGTGTLSVRNFLSVPRFKFAYIKGDSSLWIIGGEGLLGALRTIELFNFEMGTSAVVSTQLASPRSDFIAAADTNGRIYLFGGLSPDFKNGNAPIPSVEAVESLRANNVAPVYLMSVFPPGNFSLKQNYPNPFNPVTVIEFDIAQDNVRVNLSVFNILGQEVEALIDRNLSMGNYRVSFDASNLPSGIYFYTLRTQEISITKKMMVLK